MLFPDITTTETPEPTPNSISAGVSKHGKYKGLTTSSSMNLDEVNYNTIDALLEKERQQNKAEPWSKLDKTVKMQKLHHFAERYGKDHAFPVKEIKMLKTFFNDCLEKNKLNKTKSVAYDRGTREITAIPALFFNTATNHFTLKVMDTKRVSTLKLLTPKREVENTTMNYENNI